MILQVLLHLFLRLSCFTWLGLRGSDFSRVLKFPVPFLAGLLNQVVLLPLVALGLSYIFKLDQIFAVGLMIIAMCPVG